MKKYLLTIALLSIIGLINLVTAQAPNWLWARSAGGFDFDKGFSVATDASGNVFMTGSFDSPTITFGTIILTNAVSSTPDIFIVKYDSSGNVLWAQSAGGTSSDEGLSVCTDTSGNVFITGQFNSPTITFGTTTLTNADVSSDDLFIVKYDANGNVLWAQSAGGASWDYGNSVSADASGNVYITGTFNSPTITFGATTLTNAFGGGIFIVKYDSSGNVLWAKSASSGRSNSVSTDASGSVFTSGTFNSATINFGTTTLTNAGTYNIFIVKYDVNGNVLWAKSAGGVDYDMGNSVATDASGNVFMTGSFESPAITFGTTTLTNAGSSTADIFIVKYDSSGNVLWAKSAGGASYDEGFSVSTDISGNVFITGQFNSPTITFGTTTLTNADSSDIFNVKYDANGNELWAIRVGGIYSERGYSVSTDASGDVFITGYFFSPTITFGTTTLTNVGFRDIFIAKLDGTTVGIEEITEHSNISIAPNPFTSQTTITFNKEQKNTTIKITDVLGNETKTITFSGKQLAIKKGEMAGGIYFVQITDEKKNLVSRRIVIQ